MSENVTPFCPECDEFEPVDRREFIRILGGSAAGAVALSALTPVAARAVDTAKKDETKEKPAETLIKELCSGLSEEQKKQVLMPFDSPKRLGMYNGSIGTPIGKAYTKPQQELVERIIQAMCSGKDGYHQISRKGGWDNSGDLANVGAHVFGDPSKGQYSFMVSGHHLTIRCDGNTEEGPAWGGPIYYGHTPNGWSDRNVFFYQTKAVMGVHEALSDKQRKLATIEQNPGEQAGSVKFKPATAKKPGLSYGEMSKDQQELVEKAMRTILSPYRKEDADEVMDIIKKNGGFEKLHLGFFKTDKTPKDQWDFWRIEGPGFVWNFRVLPHVHCFVNISSKTNS